MFEEIDQKYSKQLRIATEEYKNAKRVYDDIVEKAEIILGGYYDKLQDINNKIQEEKNRIE